MMRRISFWLNIANSVFTLILVIIGIVKVSTSSGKFDIHGYTKYQSEIIWNSTLFKISLALLAISFIIFAISYIIESDILQKILMIISLIVPVVLVSILFSMINKNGHINEIFAIISSCTCLLPFIILLINEDFRYNFLFILISGAWIGFGIYFVYFLAVTIVLAIIIFIASKILHLFLDTPDPEYIYDKMGNVIGQIFWFK